MDVSLLKQLNQLRARRSAAIVIDDLSDNSSILISDQEKNQSELGSELTDAVEIAFKTGKSRLVEIGDDKYFINVHLPPTRLVAIGAVHISQHLAAITRTTGFDLEIIDPRTAFATPERFEGVELYPDWPEEVLAQRPLDPYCALIAVTHDPKIDDFAIISALKADCFYVGALGSRKTHAKRIDRLSEQGFDHSMTDRIHAPIGLDISAANPAEIAIAILAEVISTFRNRGTIAS